MKEIHLWNFVRSNIQKKNPVLLVAVVHHEKGSPGKQGFKMAVNSKGDYVGSIGGGIMEFNILKRSIDLLKLNKQINNIEKLYHNRKSASKKSGLICSGSQTNFTYTFSEKDLMTVERILDSVKNKTPGKMVFSPEGISVNKTKTSNQKYVFDFTGDDKWHYEQSSSQNNVLFIVGAGHVGLALSKVMSLLDFYVIVYDNRKEVQTLKENSFADKKIVDEFSNLGKYIDESENTYVVIVTSGFESDKSALEQVVNKKVRYIGLMGTMSKIKKIFSEAVKDGVRKELLQKIKAPVGIDINSDTPEEIAISIAAELIKEKN